MLVQNGGQHIAEFLLVVGRCACASPHHPFSIAFVFLNFGFGWVGGWFGPGGVGVRQSTFPPRISTSLLIPLRQGGTYVVFPGAAGESVTWNLTRCAPGAYALSFMYALAPDPAYPVGRTMSLAVSGETRTIFFPVTGGATQYRPSAPVIVPNANPLDSVELRSIGEGGPAIQDLVVSTGTGCANRSLTVGPSDGAQKAVAVRMRPIWWPDACARADCWGAWTRDSVGPEDEAAVFQVDVAPCQSPRRPATRW